MDILCANWDMEFLKILADSKFKLFEPLEFMEKLIYCERHLLVIVVLITQNR